MRRRAFIAGLAGAAAWPLSARAQQPAVPVIGLLSAQSADDDYKNMTVPFLQGLKETGFVERQNVAVEARYAENQVDWLSALAADLVRRRVAVIVAVGTAAAPTSPVCLSNERAEEHVGAILVSIGKFAPCVHRGQRMAGRQSRKLFRAPVVEGTVVAKKLRKPFRDRYQFWHTQ
jgi:putative ABC transport system substrate-binding protein